MPQVIFNIGMQRCSGCGVSMCVLSLFLTIRVVFSEVNACMCVCVCRARATLEGPFKSSHHSHSLLLLLCIVLVLWSAQQSTSQNPCVYAAYAQCVGSPQILPTLSCVPTASSLLYHCLSFFVLNTIEIYKTFACRQLRLRVTQFSSHLHTAMIGL